VTVRVVPLRLITAAGPLVLAYMPGQFLVLGLVLPAAGRAFGHVAPGLGGVKISSLRLALKGHGNNYTPVGFRGILNDLRFRFCSDKVAQRQFSLK